jgi:PAS domain S-box-containing protein
MTAAEKERQAGADPAAWPRRAEAGACGLLLVYLLFIAFVQLPAGAPCGVLAYAGASFIWLWLGLRFRIRGAAAGGLAAVLAAVLAVPPGGLAFPGLGLPARLLAGAGMLALPGLAALSAGLFLAEAGTLRVAAEQRSGLLRKIYDSLPIGMWVRAADGGTVLLNERWARFCGSGPGELRERGAIESRLGLDSEWETAARRLTGEGDGGVLARRIEIPDGGAGEPLSLTLLTVAVFIEETDGFGTLSLLVDETDLQSYKRRTRDSEERLRAALDSAGMGFWDMDVAAGTVDRDRNWYRILGLDEKEAATGRPEDWLEYVHPDDRGRVRENFQRMLAGPQLLDIEYRVRRRSGDYIWVQDRARVASVDAEGRAERVMGIMVEVSERKRWEIDLVRAKERADAANEAKSSFIATVSHEIRTPLNAIIGLSSFLLEGELDEEQTDHARMIYSSGRSLLLLVNDILDFSRIESGRLELETQEFPLKLCCEDCVKLFAGQAREKGIELQQHFEADLPEYVVGDMERLRQVVQNLLANAIKFTDSGEVELTVRRTDINRLPPERCPDPLEPLGFLDEPGQTYIEVQVRDTGIGIPADRQDALFEAFSQADASTTRRYGGTGLGLAICKRLVRAMGGRIWLESAPGEGTLIGFNFRAGIIENGGERPPDFTRSPFEPVERIAEEHPCDILVVGPKEETERLVHSCRKLGYAPHHAPDYDLRADAFRRRRYNLVFIWLGDEARGLELARQLSVNRGRTHPQSLVGVVPEGRGISRERCTLSGIAELIEVKPRPLVVRQTILGILSAHG